MGEAQDQKKAMCSHFGRHRSRGNSDGVAIFLPTPKLSLGWEKSSSGKFRTFLTGDTKENLENRIVIEDSTPNAVELMLNYLSSTASGEESWIRFFVAFTEIDRYFEETSKFREDAKKFLKSNFRKIAQNKEVWLKFIKKFPELSHEILMSLT